MYSLLYDLELTTEPSVTVDIRSTRGGITWTHEVPVDRAVHDERIPRNFDPDRQETVPPFQDRVERIIRGAAWERFVEYLGRTALNAGMEWFVLNRSEGAEVFLFSTRQQDLLAERLGREGGVVETPDRQIFVLTDRRVPGDACYCVKAKQCRVYARSELTANALRVYLSDFVRADTGQTIAQVAAEDAAKYLRTMERMALPGTPVALNPPPPRLAAAASAASPAGSAPMYVPHGLPAPASPAAIPGLPKATPTPPSRPTVERRAADIVVEDRPQDRCPECDETLFNVGGDDKLCLVCEWSSLPTIGGAGKDT
ncbi:hypothetical protein CMK11_18100 [Candidatus Poribacteria bacterium]|nr:hypothetical protein [Candidatus Poribacteria bacterium]